MKMFIVRSNKTCANGICLQDEVDHRSSNDFQSGWMLLRDLASFVTLEKRLFEEIIVGPNSNNSNDSSSRISSSLSDDNMACRRWLYKEGETTTTLLLPQLPLDIQAKVSSGMYCDTLPILEEEKEGSHLFGGRVREQFIAARLSDYLGSLLQIPQVVRCKAMEDFLASDDESVRFKSTTTTTTTSDGRHQEREEGSSFQWISEQLCRIMIIPNNNSEKVVEIRKQGDDMARCKTDFYDFFFQACELDEVAISIPRRALFTHYEHVPAGWWLVFRITTQSNCPTVHLNLHVIDDKDETTTTQETTTDCNNATTSNAIHLHGGDPNQNASSTTTTTTHRTCSIILSESICQGTSVVQYSYRCEPEPYSTSSSSSEVDSYHTTAATTGDSSKQVRYAFTFSNESNMLLRAAQLRLCVQIVPHGAFKAACYAASDQLEAEKRRQRSPLLCHVLDSVHSDPVCLIVEPFVSEDFPNVIITGCCSDSSSKSNCNNIQVPVLALRSSGQNASKANGVVLSLDDESRLLFAQEENTKNKQEIARLNKLVTELQRQLHLEQTVREQMQQQMKKLTLGVKEAHSEISKRKQNDSASSRCDMDAAISNPTTATPPGAKNIDMLIEHHHHPDKRIHAQLLGLQERRKKLLEASKRNPNAPTDLIAKLDKAIELIHTSGATSLSDPTYFTKKSM